MAVTLAEVRTSTALKIGQFVRVENPFDATYEGDVVEVRAGGEVVLDNVNVWYYGEVGVYTPGDTISLRVADDAVIFTEVKSFEV